MTAIVVGEGFERGPERGVAVSRVLEEWVSGLLEAAGARIGVTGLTIVLGLVVLGDPSSSCRVGRGRWLGLPWELNALVETQRIVAWVPPALPEVLWFIALQEASSWNIEMAVESRP